MSNLPPGVHTTDPYFNDDYNSYHHKNGRSFTESISYIDEDGFDQHEIVVYELYQGDVSIKKHNDYLTVDDLECIKESIIEKEDDYFRAYKHQ